MRRAAAALALALAASPAAALSLDAGGPGASGADFLTVGVGARALAMGSAFAAVDTGADANAVNWNPAALGLVDAPGLTASYNALFVDESQGFLGYAAPVGGDRGVWAAGLNYLIVSNIQARAGDTEDPDSTFSNQNYAASLSYGRAFGDSLIVGGTLKYIRAQLGAATRNAMAGDAGALYRTPLPGLTAGASIRNLGTDLGPDNLPLDLRGGLAYRLFGERLTFASDVDWLATERTAYASLGTELWVTSNLAVRGGYQFGHGADQLQNSLVGLGVGGGVKFRGLTMDYAFLPYGDLGPTHRVTLGLRFE